MRETGLKPYISKTYADMMRRTNNREVWNAFLVKQSEYEKPYGRNTYEEMQHYFPSLPGFPPFSWDWDFPVDPYVPDDPPNPSWDVVFFCATAPCYCEGERRCTYLACTYPIIGIEPGSCNGLTFSVTDNEICVEAGDNPDWGCEVTIVMKTPPNNAGIPVGVVGRHHTISVSECSDCEDCVPDPAMAWATATETIARSSSLVVSITGLNTPFTWEVSGTGFTLDHAQTDGLSNTLRSDASACGSATVTVTGCDGVVATGYVRCTAGEWVAVDSCIMNGGSSSNYAEEIKGNTRKWKYSGCCDLGPPPNPPGCGTSTACCEKVAFHSETLCDWCGSPANPNYPDWNQTTITYGEDEWQCIP